MFKGTPFYERYNLELMLDDYHAVDASIARFEPISYLEPQQAQ